jgi:hypothetical protein
MDLRISLLLSDVDNGMCVADGCCVNVTQMFSSMRTPVTFKNGIMMHGLDIDDIVNQPAPVYSLA